MQEDVGPGGERRAELSSLFQTWGDLRVPKSVLVERKRGIPSTPVVDGRPQRQIRGIVFFFLNITDV